MANQVMLQIELNSSILFTCRSFSIFSDREKIEPCHKLDNIDV